MRKEDELKAQEIKLCIEGAKKILLHCHPFSDLDSVGSVLAMREFLLNEGKEVVAIIEDSTLTKVVYDTVKSKKCVSIYDRITPLDYWVCVLAFIFDLNYKETYMMVKEKDYINILIDKFKYNDLKTKEQMEEVRNILNSFINEKII